MAIKKKFYLSGHVAEWHRLCLVKYLNCENFILQKSQENCISPWWTLLWIVKQSDLANFFEHISHEKGLSPVWTLLWRFKLVIWEKAIWHWSQAKGFEWIRKVVNIQLTRTWKSLCTSFTFMFPNGRIDFESL